MKVFTAIVALASTSIASAAVIWDGSAAVLSPLPSDPYREPTRCADEHQIVFWEGHYADIKYGQLSGQNGVADSTLRVITGGSTIWSLTPVKGTWYNFILGTGSPGGLWVSTGSNPLQKVYSVSFSFGCTGALRLPINGNTQVITEENIYYSGIYVEDSGPTLQP
ncbi:putative carbohydrate-binding module family 1 protein [Lyophyllum shimeji]|uniref:Carbohydrate-binding module family 1 protein n=1 Tax=Lyophyllum shimeji TaxID=47721 RepID=A0A9P3PIY2_LYOSH|nr:putative carbohydrate-binding module family 1 protein [Lyophyllum shimeji]